MPPKNGKDSAEELIIKFLKKNKNFFINYPGIIKELNFPDKTPGSENIIDLGAYRSKKISRDNLQLQKQMLEILKAGKNEDDEIKTKKFTLLDLFKTKNMAMISINLALAFTKWNQNRSPRLR